MAHLLIPALLLAVRPPTPSPRSNEVPRRSAAPPLVRTGVDRRNVLQLLPLVMLSQGAGSASAVCSCPKGLDSCVCDDQPAATTSFGGSSKRVRADAAGRDADDSKRYREEIFGVTSSSSPPPRKAQQGLTGLSESRTKRNAELANSKPAAKAEAIGYTGAAVPGYGGLTGGGSQNYGDVDVQEARARFADIVARTVAKREADLGFELDKDDIKSLISVLATKYCGPAGLIGPC